MFNNMFMQAALAEARIAFEQGEIPVGAVIVDNLSKQIIARCHNMVQAKSNATLHAEILAINQACQLLSSKYLTNCSIYTTLEPCTMCAAAIAHVKLHSLFYAASDPKQGAVEYGVRFFTRPSCFYQPEIYPGLLEEESSNLIKAFFQEQRAVKVDIDRL